MQSVRTFAEWPQVESVMYRLPGYGSTDFSRVFKRTILDALQRNPDAEPRIVIDECTNYEFKSVLEIVYPS
jgi:hypothetical protein